MTITIGSKVHFTPENASGVPTKFLGQTLTVEKMPAGVNGKNAIVRNPHGAGLRIPPAYLTEGEWKQTDDVVDYTSSMEKVLMRGTVVKIQGRPGLYVITNESYKGREVTYSAYPLGGDLRYMRSLTKKYLTVIPLNELKELL